MASQPECYVYNIFIAHESVIVSLVIHKMPIHIFHKSPHLHHAMTIVSFSNESDSHFKQHTSKLRLDKTISCTAILSTISFVGSSVVAIAAIWIGSITI